MTDLVLENLAQVRDTAARAYGLRTIDPRVGQPLPGVEFGDAGVAEGSG